MTDRHTGYIVTLDHDVPADDDSVLTALRMVRGVLSVEPVTADAASHIAEERALHRIRHEVISSLYPGRET